METVPDILRDNWAPDQAPTADRRPGDRLKDQYEIYGMIDRTSSSQKAGMGIIYVCYDLKNKMPCVLKTFQDGDLDTKLHALERFKLEIGLWTRLGRHENIVKAFWLEEIEGKPFLVLEYIRAGDLEDWLKSGCFDLRLALDFAWQIAGGMSYASKALNLIHRDLKPANILVTEEAKIKITDFGLALAPSPADNDGAPAGSGDVLQESIGGSPAWMAPEQFNPSKIDTRADIYSFGIILYQMLSDGKHPYPGNHDDWKATHAGEQPSPLTPEIPPEVRAIVDKCLLKDPRRRFESFAQVREAISRVCENLGYDNILVETSPIELQAWEISNQGSTLAGIGRFDEAVCCFNKALELNPCDYRLYNNRGLAYAGLGDMERALGDYDEALKMNRDYAECFNNRGLAHYSRGAYEEAIADFNQAIKCDIKLYQAFNNRGLANYGRNCFDQAVRDFNQAIILNPRYVEAYYNRGVALCASDRVIEAIEDFDRAIVINVGYAKAYFNRGLAHESQGANDLALLDFELLTSMGLPESDSLVAAARERIARLKPR